MLWLAVSRLASETSVTSFSVRLMGSGQQATRTLDQNGEVRVKVEYAISKVLELLNVVSRNPRIRSRPPLLQASTVRGCTGYACEEPVAAADSLFKSCNCLHEAATDPANAGCITKCRKSVQDE